MIVFPNCKINLGLYITAKRADGYHDIETIFYPLFIQDALEIISSTETSITVTGSKAGNPQQNSCLKAYALLQQDFPDLPPVRIHLHKTIPVGAGLGGGSADAAFTLLLLNKKYGLQLTTEALLHYALQVGSDCPFFILNKPCFAAGRGEKMTGIDVDLTRYKIVVVNPGIPVNTAWAFQQIQPREHTTPITEIIKQPVAAWKGLLVNDFEIPISAQYPQISDCIAALYQKGALYAAMSGSGATVFGMFEKDQQLQFSFPLAYYVKEC